MNLFPFFLDKHRAYRWRFDENQKNKKKTSTLRTQSFRSQILAVRSDRPSRRDRQRAFCFYLTNSFLSDNERKLGIIGSYCVTFLCEYHLLAKETQQHTTLPHFTLSYPISACYIPFFTYTTTLKKRTCCSFRAHLLFGNVFSYCNAFATSSDPQTELKEPFRP